MSGYEYKVVPAPEKGLKGKGVKGPRERFANALQTVMNELGAEGWEYLRADTLPCDERSGLTGTTTTYQNMLVFRRVVTVAAEAPKPKALPAHEAVTAAETATESASSGASTKRWATSRRAPVPLALSSAPLKIESPAALGAPTPTWSKWAVRTTSPSPPSPSP